MRREPCELAHRLAREAWVRTRLAGQPEVPLVSAVAATHSSLTQTADIALMREAPGRPLDARVRHEGQPRSAMIG